MSVKHFVNKSFFLEGNFLNESDQTTSSNDLFGLQEIFFLIRMNFLGSRYMNI